MIGKLRFNISGKTAVAVLHEGMHWSCNDQQVEAYLNQVCVAEGASEIHLLYQTAERLGADVVTAPHAEACTG